MTLEAWLKRSECYCQDLNTGAKMVFLGRVETCQAGKRRGVVSDLVSALWDLVDYAVSTVSGERVILVPRRAAE